MASSIKKLLFIDTNILLDFYRTRSDAGISLLKHLDAVSDKIIITFQVEMEFKKNRQIAILEGEKELKKLDRITKPGLFSDAKAVKAIEKDIKNANKRIASLKSRLIKALKTPAAHDPVYQVCQRIFTKVDDLNLTREHSKKRIIKRKALKRFLLGCPPRKKNDTSMGDAINWEWMLECADQHKAQLVIVSRDSDYGATFENHTYLNDHLRQEFSDRISKKRKILLYARLSEALKHFEIKVDPTEVQAEEDILSELQDTDPLS